MILSAAFCDMQQKWKKIVFTVCMSVILLFQGILYLLVDVKFVKNIYPLITHIPLIVVLCILTKKCLWSIISVLTAYLCCQIRHWLALLIIAVFCGDALMQNTVELIMTFPLLIILVLYIAPSVRSISHYPVLIQYQFGLIPAIYYAFDYLTSIYTNLLADGVLVAVEFMPFVCSISYLFFLMHITQEEQIHSQLKYTQDILNLQIEQAVREIEVLREAQEKMSRYRHDMRHHMQYLLVCIENGRLKQAQEYIQRIYSEIEVTKINNFCENEAANLIFSAYAKRVNDCGILIKINAMIPQTITIAENDLCVLLSNILENALYSCQRKREKGSTGGIEVTVYVKDEKLFLQAINSCDESDIIFENNIPITHRQGHGMGVRSICAIVEQYNGIYSFLAKDGQFILRISL